MMVLVSNAPELIRVEFIGLPCPIFDPAVQQMRRRNMLSPKQLDGLYKLEAKRQTRGWARFWGTTERFWTPEQSRERLESLGITHRELSRTYRWWVGNHYIEHMTPDDVETLMLLHELHATAFRRLDVLIGV